MKLDHAVSLFLVWNLALCFVICAVKLSPTTALYDYDVFEDDFETGDIELWTENFYYEQANLTVSSGDNETFRGDYGIMFEGLASPETYFYNWLCKNFSQGYQDLYVRWYMNINEIVVANGSRQSFLIFPEEYIYVGVENMTLTGETENRTYGLGWFIEHPSAYDESTNSTVYPVCQNEWTCVEFFYRSEIADPPRLGESALFIDEVAVLNETLISVGMDTALTQMLLCVDSNNENDEVLVCMDNVKVSEIYNGPEASLDADSEYITLDQNDWTYDSDSSANFYLVTVDHVAPLNDSMTELNYTLTLQLEGSSDYNDSHTFYSHFVGSGEFTDYETVYYIYEVPDFPTGIYELTLQKQLEGNWTTALDTETIQLNSNISEKNWIDMAIAAGIMAFVVAAAAVAAAMIHKRN